MNALITQREALNEYGYRIDILESSYVNFFEDLGVNLTPVSNFSYERYIENKLKYSELVILTGGGSLPYEYYDKYKENIGFKQIDRDITESYLIKRALEMNIPILAICRGMQYINGYFGGKVSELKELNSTRYIGEDHPISIKDKIIYVNNYHNDGIYKENLASNLNILAIDIENEIVESFYSKKNKILGVQWHPERKFLDYNSYLESRELVRLFILKGELDESYYFSCR